MNLDSNVECERMNVPVSTETKQRCEYSAEAHTGREEKPQICSFGNVSTDINQIITKLTQSKCNH